MKFCSETQLCFLFNFGLHSTLSEHNHRRPKDERLVAVRESTHARHDAEYVVVERVYAYLRRASTRDRVERDGEL